MSAKVIWFTVKGSKGELSQQVDPDLEIEIDGNVLTIKRPTEQKRHKAVSWTV